MEINNKKLPNVKEYFDNMLSEDEKLEVEAYMFQSSVLMHIDEELEKLSLSRLWLANQIGVSEKYINQHYNNTRLASIKKLVQMASVLELKMIINVN